MRVVGIDDGTFGRGDRWAPLAAVVMSLPSYVERIVTDRVRVDGTDGTESVIRLVERTGHADDLRAVLLDGVVVGGFNVLDLDRIHQMVRWPVIAVTRRRPDLRRIRAALEKWFPSDAAARWRRVRAHPLFPVPTAGRPILAAVAGARRREAVQLVARAMVRGFWPEPLRLAHLVAAASPGLSHPARPRRKGP